ncbi:MAG: response regulator [Acidobacteria bacterium]|nr:response regulator [Acidobacteriota bacterium]
MDRALNVLLVEDEPAHVALVERAFEDASGRAELRIATTLRSAQAAVEAAQPDVVVADFRLPDGDGTALLPGEDAEPAFPVVIMTSQGDEQVAVDAIKRGAIDYIVKSDVTLAAMPRIAQRVSRQWDHVRARRRLENQLQLAQRMDALGRLAGGVAHDFNNLLTVILGNAELLTAHVAQDEEARAYTGEILDAGRRAADLARRLLTFGRRQTGRRASVDPDALVLRLDGMLRRLLGARWEFVPVMAPGTWPIDVDAGQVEQVLVNLVVNARDATPDGGRITIEVGNVEVAVQEGAPAIDLPPGEYVRFRVCDEGPGIPEPLLGSIFEPFFTTKGETGGTGLGLAICYGIAKAHGGHVLVENLPRGGAAFDLLLPRSARPTAAARDEPRDTARWPTGAGIQVLLVEDDASVRAMAAASLRAHGYEVRDAALAVEALERAFEGAPPDLLVTDIVLPQMSGRQLAAKLKLVLPGLKVLFISGYGGPGEGAEEAGFLEKPFTPASLIDAVGRVFWTGRRR